MKSLKNLQEYFADSSFDLEYETKMVQSRLISTILEAMDEKEFIQSDLAKLTGLSQPFISAIMNNHKNLNMEHIALFQKALNIVLQPPKYLDNNEHRNKYYCSNDFEIDNDKLFKTSKNQFIIHVINDFDKNFIKLSNLKIHSQKNLKSLHKEKTI